MKLSERLEQLQAEIATAASACLFYEPKDAARDEHFRLAAAGYAQVAEAVQRLLDDVGPTLRAAEAAELVAEAEEPLT